MINKVTVINSYGEELTMALRTPEKSGYAITSITGLDPVQVDIKQTQMVSGLRYKYNKGFFKYRQIQVSIIYYEHNILNMDVVSLRQNLYKYFKTNDLITIVFEKDNEMYAIQGYVDKHDAQIFTSQGSATISITCPDPWFHKRGIDFQDEDESNSVLGIESEMYVNSVNVSYEGNIGNGFVLETETDVRNLAGEELVLESFREGTSTGKLILNVPNDYPDINCSIDSLGISLVKDSLAVYTGHKGGLQYILAADNRNSTEWGTPPETISVSVMVDGIEKTLVIRSHISENLCDKSGVNYPDRLYILSIENPVDIENPIDIDKINSIIFPVSYYGDNMNSSIETNIICRPTWSVGLNSYLLQILNPEDLNNETYWIGDNSWPPVCPVYIKSDKMWLDENKPNNYGTQSEPMDHIGWVDATSISKRVTLPRLEPGYNTITLNTSSGLPVKFKIRYNTLYRGL